MGVRFHINPKTGEPGACRAEKSCPFGNVDLHYDTKDEARAAYEASHEPFENYDPYGEYTTEDLQNLEEETLARHRAEGTPLTDEEYDRHYELVRRIRSENPSTHKQFTEKVKGKVVYTAERRAQQEELLGELEKRAAHIPREFKALMTGGITGSGKTTALRRNEDLGAKNYALVSVDDVKDMMVEKNMTPPIRGVLPLETDDLIKFEATVLSKELFDRFSATGTNVLLDKTMAAEKPMRDELKVLRDRGYTNISAVFVDVDPVDAHLRIRGRHKQGIDRWLVSGEGHGERAVPGGAITGTYTKNPSFRSKNAEAFSAVAKDGGFNESHIFDSSADGKKISLEDFGKEAISKESIEANLAANRR